MVVKYITMLLASHWFIVCQFMVSSRMLIHSAMMVALMSPSVFILFFVSFSNELCNSKCICNRAYRHADVLLAQYLE